MPPKAPAAAQSPQEEEDEEEEEQDENATTYDGSDKTTKLATVDEVITALEGKTFEDYVENFFKLDRKGMFNKKTSVEKVMKWKNDLIKTSLLQLPPDLSSEALQTFRNVTGYMGDRGSSKDPIGHVNKILSSLMLAPEQLRDEVFCQIAKQVNENPDPVSTVRGWQLMVIMLASFPPSETLNKPLQAFFASKLNAEGEFVPKYAKYCLLRCPRIFVLASR